MGIILAIMLIFVRGKIFSHYDNFSHWALVVKKMIEVDRYPNFKDTIIMFQEYPLGSATYIYYFSKLVAIGESLQMFAQIYMMVASLMPLFIFAKKNKIGAALMMLLATNLIFIYNINVTELLVDTLLPLVGMCAMLFAYIYGRKIETKREFYFIGFYMVQLIQIKNSGIFFVAMICLWLLWTLKNDRKILTRLSCIALPFISLLLWQKHCTYVFQSAETSKHAMTTANYKSVFAAKTVDEIKTICIGMLKFAVTYKRVLPTFILLAVVAILLFVMVKSERNNIIKMTILAIGMYISYQMGMLAMYLFSMPGGEATSLAGSGRYTNTILTAVLYVIILAAIKLIASLELSNVNRIIVTFLALVSLITYTKFSTGLRSALKYSTPTLRNWIETTKTAYGLPNGESYCMVLENDHGYAYYLGKYIFQSHSIGTVKINSVEDMDAISAKYILIQDKENEIVNEWVKDNYPDQYGKDVIVKGE